MFALAFASLMLAQPAPVQGAAAAVPAPTDPRVMEPFEQDWVLMDWALRNHDREGDVGLSLGAAQAAAAALKRIADGDGDGRVTTYEYDRAREFILARY